MTVALPALDTAGEGDERSELPGRHGDERRESLGQSDERRSNGERGPSDTSNDTDGELERWDEDGQSGRSGGDMTGNLGATIAPGTVPAPLAPRIPPVTGTVAESIPPPESLGATSPSGPRTVPDLDFTGTPTAGSSPSGTPHTPHSPHTPHTPHSPHSPLESTRQLPGEGGHAGAGEGGQSTAPLDAPRKLNVPAVEFTLIDDGTHDPLPTLADPVLKDFGYCTGDEMDTSLAAAREQGVDTSGYRKFIAPADSALFSSVEYDMDEQDQLWLSAVNKTRASEGTGAVSYEAFEIAFDRIEKEWFELSKYAPKKSNAIPSEDSLCAICDDGECENSNAIVFCDGCNLAVHQDCYGVPYIPEGQWLCRKCTVSPDRTVKCRLCPNTFGAFKQTTDNRWAHLVCAIWIPETYTQNVVYMEPVSGIDNIEKSRWKLVCSLCKKRQGACIQCANKNCFVAFHVTCAKAHGYEMKLGRGGRLGADELEAFCDRHSTVPRSQRRMNTTAAMQLSYASLQAHAHLPWGHASPQIVPRYIYDRVLRGIERLKFDNKGEFVSMLCQYWSLKRLARRGAPFLRRLHLTGSGVGIRLDEVGQDVLETAEEGKKVVTESQSTQALVSEGQLIQTSLVPEAADSKVLTSSPDGVSSLTCTTALTHVTAPTHIEQLETHETTSIPVPAVIEAPRSTTQTQAAHISTDYNTRHLNVLSLLRSDLAALSGVARKLLEREHKKNEQLLTLTDALCATLFARERPLRTLLERTRRDIDHEHLFEWPVSDFIAPDYATRIAHPMSWSVIGHKLDRHEYANATDFAADMELVLRNATEYNGVETWVGSQAIRIGAVLGVKWPEEITAAAREAGAGVTANTVPASGEPTDDLFLVESGALALAVAEATAIEAATDELTSTLDQEALTALFASHTHTPEFEAHYGSLFRDALAHFDPETLPVIDVPVISLREASQVEAKTEKDSDARDAAGTKATSRTPTPNRIVLAPLPDVRTPKSNKPRSATSARILRPASKSADASVPKEASKKRTRVQASPSDKPNNNSKRLKKDTLDPEVVRAISPEKGGSRQILGVSDPVVIDNVGEKDSFSLFETGWVLPVGSKRRRSGDTPAVPLTPLKADTPLKKSTKRKADSVNKKSAKKARTSVSKRVSLPNEESDDIPSAVEGQKISGTNGTVEATVDQDPATYQRKPRISAITAQQKISSYSDKSKSSSTLYASSPVNSKDSPRSKAPVRKPKTTKAQAKPSTVPSVYQTANAVSASDSGHDSVSQVLPFLVVPPELRRILTRPDVATSQQSRSQLAIAAYKNLMKANKNLKGSGLRKAWRDEFERTQRVGVLKKESRLDGTLVWAKARGFQLFYPAEIVTDMTGVKPDILNLERETDSILVSFYDRTRSFSWCLPEHVLGLGISPRLDDMMLDPFGVLANSKYPALAEALRIGSAYEWAVSLV